MNKALMSTASGITPYPKISGAGRTTGKKKIALLPEEGDQMKCSVCGLTNSANPAHGDNYTEDGKHKFSGSTKALLEEDSPISFGSELKALGDGKVGGWAVIFSDHQSPDLTNDYFDGQTDFFFEGEQKAIRPVLYDHGLDPTIKSRKLARGTVEIKDAGLWFESQLNLSNEYDAYIYELTEKKALGISTGSAPHLIKREKVGKSFHMKSWPVVEVSLTPIPIEPKTKGKVMPLKSYADEGRVDLFSGFKGVVDEEIENNMGRPHPFEPDTEEPGLCKVCSKPHKKSFDRPFKSSFEEKLAKRTESVYELDRARDDVFRDIIAADETSGITGVTIDKREKVTNVVTEYAARLIILVLEQMQKFQDGDYDNMSSPCGGGPQQFYLRSFEGENPLSAFLAVKGQLVSGVNLDRHSSEVVSALDEYAQETASLLEGVKAWIDRCQSKIEFRLEQGDRKSGRVISKATLSKIAEARQRHAENLAKGSELDAHLADLMALAEPKKSASGIDILYQLALAEHENEMAGVPST